MGRFTLYRADVDSARLARVLGKVPGVAVAGEQAGDRETDETAAPAAWTESDKEEGGLQEKLPDVDIVDAEQKSVVKTYGLLGLGVSLVLLGISTVGIWVYLRRNSDGEESETPPPATGLDTAEPAPSRTDPDPSTGEPEASPADRSPVRSDAEPDEDVETPEPRGRTEGDRTDIEWTTRDRPPEPAAPEEPAPEPTEPETDADEPRPTESVDAAPLLGVAFLAVSGAVVRWLQGDADET